MAPITKPVFKIEGESDLGLKFAITSFKNLYSLSDSHLVAHSHPIYPGGQKVVQNKFINFSVQLGSQSNCDKKKNTGLCDDKYGMCLTQFKKENTFACQKGYL